MESKIYNEFNQKLLIGKNNLIEKIKIFLYKQNKSFFDNYDFNNDLIYLEPLLFAGITSKKKENIDNILFSYSKDLETDIKTNSKGYFYIPKIGYFFTELKEQKFTIQKKGSEFYIYTDTDTNCFEIEFKFEKIKIIQNKFELLNYPLDILHQHFFDEFGTDVPVEIIEISKKQEHNLSIALSIIKLNSPTWYKLLSDNVQSIVIFNDSSKKRNSFATQSVHGCIFLNSFQDDYNEVFFIEDIAHQGGHVIFNTYLSSDVNPFLMHKNTEIYLRGERDKYNEPRALYVMLHAMYTYESIFTCFNACLKNNVFNGQKKHELLGRLTFTLLKFERDLDLLMDKDEKGNNVYFTSEGIDLINEFVNNYNMCLSNWGNEIKNLNLTNQSYNFSYTSFLELNPLEKCY